ncbi:MAG: hypothetical protein IKZ49_02655 [Alphaproteobacteria bacterium]|nr:hypothetical protein [Alphaproteobacteria bacterium]
MTRLRKNVYKADLAHLNSHFCDSFAHAKQTALPIYSINGKVLSISEDGAIPTQQFPNPNAYTMLFEYFYVPKKADYTLSTTIIEYYNKEKQPVAYLFPDGSIYKTGIQPINKRILRDIRIQIKIRKSLLGNEK